MATDGEKKAVEESPAAKERVAAEVVTVELPAPPGWRKKFTPKKGGTPRRNEIVFMSPTGEEVKNKRQLDIYLRSHPGNPSSSEFDWGSGEAPRRSLRISEKVKATDIPEGEKPKKRARNVEKDTIVEATVAVEKMKEAEGGKEEPKEVSIETAVKEGAVRQDSLDETKENIEEKTEKLEESSKVDPAASESEAGENKGEPETEKPADAEILPPETDKKERASAGKEMKIGDLPNNGTHKDNEAAAPKDAPSVNCDDGQH